MDSDITRTRRQMIRSTVGFLGAALGAVTVVAIESGRSASATAGSGSSIVGPARVMAPAVRLGMPAVSLGVTAELGFPLDAVGDELTVGDSYVSGVHNGIDIGNECTDGTGRQLLACTDAVVNSIRVHPKAGKMVILRDRNDTYYRYHHLDAYVDGMVVGDAVVRGQIVGYMGHTGNTSWAHLHFEVWRSTLDTASGGRHVDPLPLLSIPAWVDLSANGCAPLR